MESKIFSMKNTMNKVHGKSTDNRRSESIGACAWHWPSRADMHWIENGAISHGLVNEIEKMGKGHCLQMDVVK